jgi:hypothetical protein
MKTAGFLGASAFLLVLSNFAVDAAGQATQGDAKAKTYYVDYASGSDSQDGTAKDAPWKHCCGDPEATGKAKAAALAPGDRVLFKGGVNYRGGIVLRQSGAEGKPIVYEGNNQEGFGAGRAIVDGSEPLGGWHKCASADECDGNPNWANIWWTEVPYPLADPSLANLYQDQDPLEIAQDPRPRHPFPPDPATEYYSFDANKAASIGIEDEKYFTQAQPHAWDGALVLLYLPGGMYFQKVTGFDPAAHKIAFGDFGAGVWGVGKKTGKFAMLNAMAILKQPGQYVVRSEAGKSKIYLWPIKGGAEPTGVTISRRATGFNLNGQSYVTVEGFVIQKYVGTDGSGSAIEDKDNKPNGGLIIRDNVITACSRNIMSSLGCFVIYLTGQKGSLVERNLIQDNRGSEGIAIYKGAGHVIRDNVIRRYSSAAICLGKISAKDCHVLRNTVEDSYGAKSFAIVLYGDVSRILVAGNRFTNTGNTVVLSKASDITFACNVFESNRPVHYILFDESVDANNIRLFHNVAINAGPGVTDICGGNCFKSAVMKNNIFVENTTKLDAATGFKMDDSHNLHTDVAHMGGIFADPEHRDFRLKKGSPAIGAGVATEIQQDAAGTAFPKDKPPDVGAYVYTEK